MDIAIAGVPFPSDSCSVPHSSSSDTPRVLQSSLAAITHKFYIMPRPVSHTVLKVATEFLTVLRPWLLF